VRVGVRGEIPILAWQDRGQTDISHLSQSQYCGLGCVLVMGREEEKKATRVHIGKLCSNLNLGNDRRWHCWSVPVRQHITIALQKYLLSRGKAMVSKCWLSQPLPTQAERRNAMPLAETSAGTNNRSRQVGR
jgi:hypothetical protein